jgi:uncharacterized membrane protein YoaK (UPF0700 family)
MLGVFGLAAQNSLVQASMPGAPSTAVMTTNMTRFMHDLTEIFFGTDPRSAAVARSRAANTWRASAGFAAGAAGRAPPYAATGIESLALFVGLALLAAELPGSRDPRG